MSHIQSSFPGKIRELPGIYVDNFENPEDTVARAYFISHYHSDHVKGLHSPQLLKTLQKTQAKIYTSKLTAAIIDVEKTDPRLMEYVRGLQTGSTLITLPATEEHTDWSITVTLIPAAHCAGSVMFLFTLDSQTILYTGDFRASPDNLPQYTALHDNDGSPIKINTLYIDTTFINNKFENFPRRKESVDELVFHIKKWMNAVRENSVAIHTSAKYGYEYVFNEIHKQLGFKVYVKVDRWRFYSKIPNLVPGVTNNCNETRIHLCSSRNGDTDHVWCIGENKQKFLFVYLSAMKWELHLDDVSSVDFVSPSRVDVCFATHCSRREIYYFVNYLSPDKIVGFPNDYVDIGVKRTSKLEFARDVKKVKVDKQVDENLLRKMFD